MCANTAGIVTKVSPGPAVGSKPKAKTGGITIKPPKRAAIMPKNATQAVERGRLASSERYDAYTIRVPAPTESEKKQKPMALNKESAVKSSHLKLNMNSTPAHAPGSVNPRMIKTIIKIKRVGIKYFDRRSIPA